MLVLIAALGGCMIAEPFEKPEIVAGGESTVTIRTGSIRSAQTTAERQGLRLSRVVQTLRQCRYAGVSSDILPRVRDCDDAGNVGENNERVLDRLQ